jgi:Zn-dependent metalloprotease
MKRLLAISLILALWVLYSVLARYERGYLSEAVKLPDQNLLVGSLMPWSLPKPRGADERLDIVKPADVSQAEVIEAGGKYLQDHRDELQLQSYHQFRPVVSTSPLGASLVYQVYQDGLPVVGMELRLKLNRENEVKEVSGNYRPMPKVDLDEEVMLPNEILQRIPSRFAVNHLSSNVERELIALSESDELQLVYAISARDRDNNLKPVQIIVKASDGEIVRKAESRPEF